MSDIVERLRHRHVSWLTVIPAMEDAATEIERLRLLQEEMVAVLNGARICLKKTKDHTADEVRVMAAIVSVLARAEA